MLGAVDEDERDVDKGEMVLKAMLLQCTSFDLSLM
jgi:hypothetical protein